ncbi:MAG TPA: hypothetical protein VK934_09065 [Fimbriimonas sp.]|nr:hypothetical protein [Fimbriimonas sp.]
MNHVRRNIDRVNHGTPEEYEQIDAWESLDAGGISPRKKEGELVYRAKKA